MLKFLTAGVLAFAYLPAGASGQGVDYLAFGALKPGTAFLLVQPVPEAPAPPPQDLDEAQSPLALDFANLPREHGQPVAAARISKSAPLAEPHPPASMTPHRPSAKLTRPPAPWSIGDSISAPMLWAAAPAGCSNEAYQPKGLKREVEERRARYFTLMAATACRAGVPVKLFDALVTQESGYNPLAISAKGAIGMAQLMPGTARMAGVNPWDIAENLRGGAQILKAHLSEFGRYDLALAAYNAGAGRVRHTGRVPRIRETTAYVSSILGDLHRQYARAIGLPGPATGLAVPIRTASLLRF